MLTLNKIFFYGGRSAHHGEVHYPCIFSHKYGECFIITDFHANVAPLEDRTLGVVESGRNMSGCYSSPKADAQSYWKNVCSGIAKIGGRFEMA